MQRRLTVINIIYLNIRVNILNFTLTLSLKDATKRGDAARCIENEKAPAKVFEIMLYKYASKYIEEYLIDPQHGFRV